MFKRRDKRPMWQILLSLLWPKGGWGRAAQYVKHRLHRLPDTPERIARGIFVGVFTTFTPFYGLHFVIAALLAKMVKGNVIAALLGTFFGNPLTYVPIGIICLKTGYALLGMRGFGPAEHMEHSLVGKFVGAFKDLKHNLWASLTGEPTHWGRLSLFYDEVFFPYMIGGIIPGLIAATASYYLSVPLLRAYQKRRLAARMKKARAQDVGG